MGTHLTKIIKSSKNHPKVDDLDDSELKRRKRFVKNVMQTADAPLQRTNP